MLKSTCRAITTVKLNGLIMFANIVLLGDINARSIMLHFIDKFWEVHNKDKPLFVICGDIVDKQAMNVIIPYILQTLISGSCVVALCFLF